MEGRLRQELDVAVTREKRVIPGPPSLHIVIPGRDEVANPESIHQHVELRNGFWVCACRRIPE
jgi:hypothetical protein